MFRRFDEAESGMPDDVPLRYERFIVNLTGMFENISKEEKGSA